MVAKTKSTTSLKQLITTQPSLIFSSLVGVIIAYAFLSRAFDTGSYWQYAGSVFFAVLAVKLLKRSLKK